MCSLCCCNLISLYSFSLGDNPKYTNNAEAEGRPPKGASGELQVKGVTTEGSGVTEGDQTEGVRQVVAQRELPQR